MKKDCKFVLSRIEDLRKERGWSVATLAKEAGLSVSTLNNFYLRESVPSVSTLELICNAFRIDLSEFFSDLDIAKNQDEAFVLESYRKLSTKEQDAVRMLLGKLKER